MHLRVNGTRLFFDIEGAGWVPDGPVLRQKPTLLLLHGGPGFDHSTFKPAFGALADLVQIVYLDHRGMGRSEGDRPENWTLAQWGEDVRAFCEALGIERPIVLGQSFGGFVAQAYATRYPSHPAKLILSSTAARGDLQRILAAFDRRAGSAVRAVAERFWRDISAQTVADYVRECLPFYTVKPATDLDHDAAARRIFRLEVLQHFSGRYGEYWQMDFTAALSRIRCPALVLAGGQDPVTPLADSEDLVAALPPGLAHLKVFPHCGHGVFRDDPEHAFAVIRAFIAADEPSQLALTAPERD
jgi:proline iminopeptidase